MFAGIGVRNSASLPGIPGVVPFAGVVLALAGVVAGALGIFWFVLAVRSLVGLPRTVADQTVSV